MGRSRSRSRTPKRHHKSKHHKKSKSKDRERDRERSERRSISILSHSKYSRDRSHERSPKSRKRSVSVSSRSSSDDSLDLPKRRKKSGRRKLDEVERLAEMERQRRQKEVEQKTIEGEAARRIEFLVKKRVEEELEKRKDEIEQEVNRRVEAAKGQMEREMMLELEKRREAARLEEQKREDLQDIDLNLEIPDDEEEVDVQMNDGTVIGKLRKIVKKIRKSVQLRQKLKKICELYGMKYLVPIIDVTTRWNSTFHMIVRAQKLRIPLRHLCQNEKSLKSLWLASIEWQELEKVEGLLEKFDRSTKLMSMERHPTSAKYLPTLNWLIEVLSDYTTEHSDGLAEVVKAGRAKLQKYEELMNESTIPFICTFLHPALKMNYYKEYYNKHAVRDINSKISTYFLANYVNTTPTQSQTSKRKANQIDDADDEFTAHLFKRSKRMNESTEMKKYMDQDLSKPEENILGFWKSRQNELPLLSAMARDFLPIQSSSVAVERDFSSGVDIVTPNRNRLMEKTIKTNFQRRVYQFMHINS